MNCTNLSQEETDHLFRCFCSFVCIATNKKHNLANILLLYLQQKPIRDFFKALMDVKEDFGAVKIFLEFDPSLYKSKYIMKFLNNSKSRILE